MELRVIARTYESKEMEQLKSKILIGIKSMILGTRLSNEEIDNISSIDISQIDTEDLSELVILGGKLAGICYMKDDYLSADVQNKEKALKRANMTSKSGHHSVFDHGYVTIQLTGIPKILAMILNSTQFYTTSEKSARYTVMKPETSLENEVYEKWSRILESKIKSVYKHINDKDVSKLAQENARYLISVFTPTSMAYTTSYRQLNYIADWCDKLVVSLNNLNGNFNNRLKESTTELRDLIVGLLGERDIYDNKDSSFDFMVHQVGENIDGHRDYIGNVYSIKYLTSLASLAQDERHRTINYKMLFTGDRADEFGFYIPEIILDEPSLVHEWLKDIKSVAYCYPQGTLVTVVEEGSASNFFLKCKERLCGRAQLEIMRNTVNNLKKFDELKYSLSSINREKINSMTQDGFVTKCGFKDFKCTEGCIWGLKGLDRNI